EGVRIPLLYIPEITGCVIVDSIFVRKGDQGGACKCVWHHAIVRRVDERRIHQLAPAPNFLINYLDTPISLTKHAEGILVWGQQPRTAFIRRSEKRHRSIVRSVHSKHVTDETRSKCNPAPGGQGLRLRIVKIVARQIICASYKLEQGVAKERRR